MESLIDQYHDYVESLRDQGIDLVMYSCPHCSYHLHGRVPRAAGEIFDSVTTCPRCARIHFKVVYGDRRVEVVIHGEVKDAWLDPFLGPDGTGAVDVQSRLHALEGFNQAQLKAALEVPGLQATVERKARSLLRKLEKREAKS